MDRHDHAEREKFRGPHAAHPCDVAKGRLRQTKIRRVRIWPTWHLNKHPSPMCWCFARMASLRAKTVRVRHAPTALSPTMLYSMWCHEEGWVDAILRCRHISDAWVHQLLIIDNISIRNEKYEDRLLHLGIWLCAELQCLWIGGDKNCWEIWPFACCIKWRNRIHQTTAHYPRWRSQAHSLQWLHIFLRAGYTWK